MPQGVGENVLDSLQQLLENGQSATQALASQQICLPHNVNLLKTKKKITMMMMMMLMLDFQ
jgi:hypothetical protein